MSRIAVEEAFPPFKTFDKNAERIFGVSAAPTSSGVSS